jgi:hypothetical protein
MYQDPQIQRVIVSGRQAELRRDAAARRRRPSRAGRRILTWLTLTARP